MSQVMHHAFNINYKVLDDFRGIIDPEFLDLSLNGNKLDIFRIYGDDFSKKDIHEKLKPHEVNTRCLRSVSQTRSEKPSKPHHYFRAQSREKAFNSM